MRGGQSMGVIISEREGQSMGVIIRKDRVWE